MGPSSQQFEAFHDALYEWAIDASALPKLMTATRGLVDAPMVDIGILDIDRGGLVYDYVDGVDPTEFEAYQSEYFGESPRASYLMEHRTEGVFHDGIFIDEQSMNRNGFYEWLNRIDGRYTLANNVFVSENKLALFGILRGKAQRHSFSDHEISTLDAITPHLKRGMRLWWELENTRARSKLFDDLYDHSGCGIVYLNEQGLVWEMNSFARNLLSTELNLIKNGKLSAGKEDNWKVLFERVDACFSRPSLEYGTNVDLDTTREGFDGRAFFVPVNHKRENQLAESLSTSISPKGVIYIFPSKLSSDDLARRRLQRAYGLGKQQATVALQLANGVLPKQIAGKMSLSEATIRSHIRQVYKKLGTRRAVDVSRIITEMNAYLANN